MVAGVPLYKALDVKFTHFQEGQHSCIVYADDF